jgi:hypothetical protein
MSITLPDPRKCFDDGYLYTRNVTLRAYMPNHESTETPHLEIGWQVDVNDETWNNLMAYQTIMSDPMEYEIWGSKIIITPHFRSRVNVQFFLCLKRTVDDAVMSALAMLERSEIERMINRKVLHMRNTLEAEA